MGLEHRLDLGGGDIFTAHLQHVLGPAVKHHLPIGIDRSDVAGVEPSVPDHLGSLVRGVVIALQHVRAPNHDLEIGRAHVRTQVTYPLLVCRLLLEKNNNRNTTTPYTTPTST